MPGFAATTKQIIISELMASNTSILQDAEGEYSDWIELYNPGDAAVNLKGWRLTDYGSNLNKWVFPEISIEPGEYIVIFTSGKDKVLSDNEMHTNFSLSKDGEYLALVDAAGNISDHYNPAFPPMESDISFGHYGDELMYFEIPTPGAVNNPSTKAQTPSFSRERGYFDQPFLLSLSVSDPETLIYYSTDGTRPDAKCKLYDTPVFITKSTVFSAIGIKNGLPGSLITHTYLNVNDIVKQPENPEGYPDKWGVLGSDIKYSKYPAGERAPADYAMDPEICENAQYKNSMKEAFLSIPTVSVVTNPGYLFSDTIDEKIGGIYIHTGVSTGDGWERPVSLEYFDPKTQKQFQINCGLKLHGAASRQPEKTGKHSFRASFRGVYGAGKLRFDLFEKETAVQRFDHLVFRAGYNQSWLHTDNQQRTNTQYTNDSFAKRIQLAMGHPSTHDKFVHLFLNGLYWGLYNISERVSDNFMSDYFDGGEADFDIINHDGLAEGDITAFNRLTDLAKVSDYNQIVSENLIFMENFIDYMLINFYIGNTDWAHNNWYAARNRVNPGNGFYFFSWDAETSLTDVNINRINGGSGFYGKLRTILFGSSSGTNTSAGLYNNAEFRLLFADRVNRHFSGQGVLTAEKTAALFREINSGIYPAIIAESARWGDYRKDVLKPSGQTPPLYTVNDHWNTRQEKLLKDYFPKRSAIVYSQLQQLGLTGEIDAPLFSHYNPVASEPLDITITANNTVFYTTNGSDPRITGTGEIHPAAFAYATPVRIQNNCILKARSKSGTKWSALTETQITVQNSTGTQNEIFNKPEIYYSDNALHLILATNSEVRAEVISVDGRILQSTELMCNAGYNMVQLTYLPKGVYLYRLKINDQYVSGRFVKYE